MEKTEEELVAGRSLVDLVFSWSIGDVLNKDLCRNKVCMHACHSAHVYVYDALQIFNFLYGLFFWLFSGEESLLKLYFS